MVRNFPMSKEAGWTLQVTGEADNPDKTLLVVMRHDPPQIRLEIHAPELASVEGDQIAMGRILIQHAISALQKALDSPSALPGLR
jgi:hypothetical protein